MVVILLISARSVGARGAASAGSTDSWRYYTTCSGAFTAGEFGVDRIRQRVASFNRDNFAVKKGWALMPVCFGISFTKSHLNQRNALLHVYTDGSVSVITGGIEAGQGISSNVATVVARTFGISRRRVRVE